MQYHINGSDVSVWPVGDTVSALIAKLVAATVANEAETKKVLNNGHINLKAGPGERIFSPLESCPFILTNSGNLPVMGLSLLRGHPNYRSPEVFLEKAGFTKKDKAPVSPGTTIICGLFVDT